ncbi:MAG: NUDIX hydrolase [Spirochaetaceae bacterium]|jgi:ADP-ribose pyrophosphatase|nr:NUDIX hydrolase [Spirochaetaceae bacterium]
MNDKELQWTQLEKILIGDYSIFKSYRLKMQNHQGTQADFYQLDSSDWVTLIPRDVEGRFLLVQQYRMGSQCLSVEFPAGAIEPEEQPSKAGVRELKEETGFTAEKLTQIGRVNPNPAFMNNQCWTFLAEDIRDSGVTSWDEHESMVSLWMTEKEIDHAISAGEIYSAIMIQAWYWYKKRESN